MLAAPETVHLNGSQELSTIRNARRMSVATQKSHNPAAATVNLSAIRGYILARIASSGGATRAKIVRDLAPLVSHKLSPADWRETAVNETAELLALGLCEETRCKLTPTSAGLEHIETFLGSKNPKTAQAWSVVRDGRLVAKTLNLTRVGATTLKALDGPDGLRALILQKAFSLRVKGATSASNLRIALALVALERAFGNKIKTGLGSGSGLSARAGRLLAGQLSLKPQDFGTDVRLVTQLAAEAVNARQTDTGALRLASLKGFISRSLEAAENTAKPHPKPSEPANDKGIPGAAPHAIRRPGPEEFVRLVNDAAATCAQGWAGNRKALISQVWTVIEERHPGWALSPIEFKCMLAESHRSGLLMLASADLKSKDAIKDLEASAITYKNTIWHLVRLPEEDN